MNLLSVLFLRAIKSLILFESFHKKSINYVREMLFQKLDIWTNKKLLFYGLTKDMPRKGKLSLHFFEKIAGQHFQF